METVTITPTDESHLAQLATGFRVVGGLMAVCANFGWIHFSIGIMMLLGKFDNKTQKTPLEPMFGFLFAGAGFAVIVLGITLGVLGWKVARALENRTNHKFCTVISVLYLFFQPVGTALGVLALIVLNRQQVRAAFTGV